MKLKINVEQEMTQGELDAIYEEFGIENEDDKPSQLCFLLKSILAAQLNSNDDLRYLDTKPKVSITIE